MITMCDPKFTQEMKDAAISALENEFYVMGESVHKFEEAFAKYCGAKHAIAVSSGTAALQLCLEAFDVRGKKVLTTPNSFIATSNSVIHAGGTPIFSDIESQTGNLDASLLQKQKVDEAVKGIIPVHLYGQPVDMYEMMEFAKSKGLFLLEDACQAHGALYDGKKVGTIGDAGCFSFYTTKNMNVCGDGGMVVTNNDEIANKVKMLHDCGRISKYEHTMVGYTYRLNTVNAAIGIVQLKHLDEWTEKRRKLAAIYRKMLPVENCLVDKPDRANVYHLFVLKAKNRDEIAMHLKKNEIVTGINYPIPLHLQPVYRQMYGYKEGAFPVAELFAKQILSLPLHQNLTEDQVKFVAEKVLEVLK